MLSAEGFSVGDVSRVGGGPKELLRVEFETRHRVDAKEHRGWFVVSPDEAWVVYSFEVEMGHLITQRGTISYSGVHGGVPLPKRVIYTREPVAGSSPLSSPRPIPPGKRATDGSGAPLEGAWKTVTTFDFDELSLVGRLMGTSHWQPLASPRWEPRTRATGNSARWLLALACAAMAAAVALKAAAARLRKVGAPDRRLNGSRISARALLGLAEPATEPAYARGCKSHATRGKGNE